MSAIPLSEAKAHFSSLVHEVESEGKRFTVTRNGKPVARLVPLSGSDEPQGFGILSQYADSTRRLREDDAWSEAVKVRHARRT